MSDDSRASMLVDENPYKSPVYAEGCVAERGWIMGFLTAATLIVVLPILALLPCILAVWIAASLLQAAT